MAILVSDAQASIQAKGYGTDTAAQQIIAINAAHRRILTQRRWVFMERSASISFAVGIAASIPNTNVQTVEGIHLADSSGVGYSPDYIDLGELRDLRVTCPVTGPPEKWSISNNGNGGTVIEVYPNPDQSYVGTVDYITVPLSLTTAGASLMLPDAFLDLVVWGAVVDMAFRQRDNGAMSMAKQQYDERLREMVAQYGVRQSQTASTVQRWAGWENVER